MVYSFVQRAIAPDKGSIHCISSQIIRSKIAAHLDKPYAS